MRPTSFVFASLSFDTFVACLRSSEAVEPPLIPALFGLYEPGDPGVVTAGVTLEGLVEGPTGFCRSVPVAPLRELFMFVVDGAVVCGVVWLGLVVEGDVVVGELVDGGVAVCANASVELNANAVPKSKYERMSFLLFWKAAPATAGAVR